MKILPVNLYPCIITNKTSSHKTNKLEYSPITDSITFSKKKTTNEPTTIIPIYKAGETAYDISYSKQSFLKGNYEMVSEDVELTVTNGTVNAKRIVRGEAFDKEINLVLDSGLLGTSSGKIYGNVGDKPIEIRYRQENDKDLMLIGNLEGLNENDINIVAVLAVDKIKNDVQKENDFAMLVVSS